MNKNTYNTGSLIDIISKIDSEDIVLPEFQRDFVWDISRTYDLFDSLIKDIFVGTIIYGLPSFEITVREIDMRPRAISGKRRKKLEITSFSKEEVKEKVQIKNFRIVLDGQQRITSIYRAIKGIDNLWFIIKNDDELEDEVDNYNELLLSQLVSSIDGKEDNERLSVKLSDAYNITKNFIMEEDIRLNFFDKLLYIRTLSSEDKETAFKRYNLVVRKLEELMKSEKLLSYFQLEMNTEKFALFFERSNSRGINLNFIDILVAKLYSGFNLRKKTKDFEEKHKEYKFNREIIARTIAFIVSNGKNVDKNFILSNLTASHFDEYWDSLCCLYKSSLDFLYCNNYIISQYWMPYPNTIIPLMIFLKSLPNQSFSQMNESQRKFISYWYWSSVLSQRYVSSSNEMIIQDSKILEKISINGKISDKYYFSKLKPIIEKPEDIKVFSRKGSAVYMGILNFINFVSHGLLDWNNSSKIQFNTDINDHHIFPVAYLKKKLGEDELEDNLLDCVANRTLIPKITNVTISDKCPSYYLADLLKKNSNLQKSLDSHLIPRETISGLYDDFYEDFLSERCKLIFSSIKEHVLSLKIEVEDHYFESLPKSSNVITIFGNYHGKREEARFNVDKKEILYKEKSYKSVSAAADAAKKNISGRENTSTNGWRWWKYSNGIEDRFIDDYRDDYVF